MTALDEIDQFGVDLSRKHKRSELISVIKEAKSIEQRSVRLEHELDKLRAEEKSGSQKITELGLTNIESTKQIVHLRAIALLLYKRNQELESENRIWKERNSVIEQALETQTSSLATKTQNADAEVRRLLEERDGALESHRLLLDRLTAADVHARKLLEDNKNMSLALTGLQNEVCRLQGGAVRVAPPPLPPPPPPPPPPVAQEQQRYSRSRSSTITTTTTTTSSSSLSSTSLRPSAPPDATPLDRFCVARDNLIHRGTLEQRSKLVRLAFCHWRLVCLQASNQDLQSAFTRVEQDKLALVSEQEQQRLYLIAFRVATKWRTHTLIKQLSEQTAAVQRTSHERRDASMALKRTQYQLVMCGAVRHNVQLLRTVLRAWRVAANMSAQQRVEKRALDKKASQASMDMARRVEKEMGVGGGGGLGRRESGSKQVVKRRSVSPRRKEGGAAAGAGGVKTRTVTIERIESDMDDESAPPSPTPTTPRRQSLLPRVVAPRLISLRSMSADARTTASSPSPRRKEERRPVSASPRRSPHINPRPCEPSITPNRIMGQARVRGAREKDEMAAMEAMEEDDEVPRLSAPPPFIASAARQTVSSSGRMSTSGKRPPLAVFRVPIGTYSERAAALEASVVRLKDHVSLLREDLTAAHELGNVGLAEAPIVRRAIEDGRKKRGGKRG